jgi:hypothetical protein
MYVDQSHRRATAATFPLWVYVFELVHVRRGIHLLAPRSTSDSTIAGTDAVLSVGTSVTTSDRVFNVVGSQHG